MSNDKLMQIVKKIAESYRHSGVVPARWIAQLGDAYYESENIQGARKENIYDGSRVRHGLHRNPCRTISRREIPSGESAVGEQLELELNEKNKS